MLREFYTDTGPKTTNFENTGKKNSPYSPQPQPPQLSDGPPGSQRSQRSLSTHDAEYLKARAVRPGVAEAAGWWTARKPSEHPEAFGSYQRRRTPSLIAPHLSPDGITVGYQKRDLRPGRNRKGEPVKWVSPKGSTPVLAAHPSTVGDVRRGTGPLWIAEGITRMLALTGLGETAISYAGCWVWQSGGEPLACWDYVNLKGRTVYDVPDADYRINDNVQQALAKRVAFLESRGARVLIVSVPEVNGDPTAGLDDYLAAGGDLKALADNARPFAPVDVGEARLKRSPDLQRGVRMVGCSLRALETRSGGECSAFIVARYLAEELAPARGKPRADGIRVECGVRRIAAGVRIGLGAVTRALARLEDEAGFLKKLEDAQGTKSAAYLILYPSPGGCELAEHIGRGSVEGIGRRQKEGMEERSLYERESYASVPQTRAPREGSYTSGPQARGKGDCMTEGMANGEGIPALRNPKVVHTWARKNGRRVIVDSDYVGRYGKKREAIIRYVLDCGDASETELHEKFGTKTSRLRDFRKTWITPMVEDGVFTTDGRSVLPAADWLDALERVRERTDEDLDNRLQDKRIADQQSSYRRARNLPVDPTPELAGPEKAAEMVARAEERDYAARLEDQRRKVGVTPEVFLADTLKGVSGFAWKELKALWEGKGGNGEHLRRSVKDPYRFRRGADNWLYVERIGATPEPDHEPAPVAVLRDPEPAPEPEPEPEAERPPATDWRSHPLDCECLDCASGTLTYVRPWSGA
jgi:hypothetical protein